MSFFIKGKHHNGLKRAKYSNEKNKRRKLDIKSKNEEVTSSEDEGLDNDVPEASSEDENETTQEKKLRLAKLYLEEIEKEEKARLESNELDQGILTKRLKEDYLKESGRLRLTVANKYKDVDGGNVKVLKCREHRNSITCLCVTSDDKYIFAGSKDGVVVKYSLLENKKIGIIPFVKQKNSVVLGHNSQILSVAVSTDSKYLVVGDESSDIYIWDASTLKFIKRLTGHKKAVTGLCFKKDSHTLYSCSKDRLAKVWSLDEMAYVETLFGHQDNITSVDALYRDRVVTCGGRDLRIWKITEETQLIFNGHSGNIDSVKLINEENFISGGDDGQLCIWSIMRKKPLCVIHNAHGLNDTNQQPYWITAVTALLNTDVVASGSQDGFVRLWKLENSCKSISLLLKIPVEGFVNSLNFTSDGSRLIVAVSKEHRLGRWATIKSAKNCIMIIPFIKE
ncbi:hypothetical protein NQ314_006752 [Rhamnusium bicolor]|uniref:U3 small nucleolar RNA-interacting protein 2 n=1 Tax=Rhamnusium bicolor TaxID=1586634 RepID=A0AAV8YXZ2_9CUCU|nr:hypothetical protein NQ314_006752 [Rhamnusium bicolor]